MKESLFMDSAENIIKANKYPVERKKKGNVITTHFLVDDENFREIKRNKGDYYTISYEAEVLAKYPTRISKEVENVLNKLLKEYKKDGKTLVIGLGNSSVLADALGPETTKKIIATNHFDDFLTIPRVALFVPEVIGKTGISSYRLIKMVVENLKPDTIIVIDSLATKNKKNLNSCIEISDTGIIPGSAINNNKEISFKTFGVPIIAIGVPLMIDIENELYTTPNIHNVVNISSDIIAQALNSNLYS